MIGTNNFQELARCLTGDQTPRVWSLLVTVLGELAQDEGSKISGALLGHLTALMGIKPEAMRVALHRLRKDGWIDSERDGRRRTHFLTAWGRAQSAAATPRIYGLSPIEKPAWVAICDPAEPMGQPAPHAAWVASNIVITTQPEQYKQAFLAAVAADCPLPDWMRQKICTPETTQLAATFRARLEALDAQISDGGPLCDLEVAALRVLIVHGWRRIILRTPELPDSVFPTPQDIASCRNRVAKLLETYPRCRLERLEAQLA